MYAGHIIIIGAMKAGTTTLYHLLSQHSQIATATSQGFKSRKELDYFLKERRLSYDQLFLDRSFLSVLFAPRAHRSKIWTLEASPSYTKAYQANGCEARIASLPSVTKLIYVLRDPVDRIDSHVAHNRYRARAISGKRAANICVDASLYWKHIKRFRDAGLGDALLLLDFDELCRDPAGLLKQIHAFVGLPFEEPFDVGVRNARPREGRVLTVPQERRYWAAVRSDVEGLAASGCFDPAQGWLETWSARFG